MEKGIVIKKVLSILGTVIVLFPILFTVATSAAGTLMSGEFRFDYLMPAELFLLVFVGAVLLLVVSLQSRYFRVYIAIGFSCAVLLFFGMQAVAFLSGLASGETAEGGWAWTVVIAMIILYIAAVIELGVMGVVLTKKLFAPKPAAE